MFPQLYHAHHSRHIEDLPFWLELARMQCGPVLELGCGTGRVLIALTRAGYTTYGLDREAGMLSLLQQEAGGEMASRCHLFQADMSAYRLGRTFPLILLPCNTLSTLPGDIRRLALAQVRRQIAPDGLFAASLPNPALLKRLSRHAEGEIEEVFPHPADGEPVQVSSTWERRAGEVIISWRYDHLLPDGRVERFTAQACHTLTPVEQYRTEFRQAGLQIEALYGDFDRSSYTDDSPDLIILARAGA